MRVLGTRKCTPIIYLAIAAVFMLSSLVVGWVLAVWMLGMLTDATEGRK